VIQEEGLVAPGHPLDEVFRVSRELLVELSADLDGDLLEVLDLFPFDAMDDMVVEGNLPDQRLPFRVERELGRELLVLPIGVEARPAEKTVEIVEANVVRLRFLILAAMPLAHRLGEVARFAQQPGDRRLVSQASRLACEAGPQLAMPHGQAPGQERAPRRSARGLRIGRQEMEPFAPQAIDVGCRRAAHQAATVDAQVAICCVVHQEDQNVGLFPGLLLQIFELLPGLGCLLLMRDYVLHVIRDHDGMSGQRVGDLPCLRTGKQGGLQFERQRNSGASGGGCSRSGCGPGYCTQPGERRSCAGALQEAAT